MSMQRGIAGFRQYKRHMLAVALAAVPAAAMAQTATTAELEALVRQQGQQIELLQQRLRALEGQQAVTSAAPPTSIASQPTTPPEMAARLEAIEKRQAQQPTLNWKKGAPELTSADGESSMRMRGRLQVDTWSTGGSSYGARNVMGTEMRAGRLGIEGSLGKPFSYALEVDFADADVSVKSAYLAWATRLGENKADLSVGNRFADLGMDGATSGTNTRFIERNFVGSAVRPASAFYGLGLMGRVLGERWHASVQISGDDVGSDGTARDSLTYKARAHWNPVKTKADTLHLGVWGFHENLSTGTASLALNTYVDNHFNDQLRISSGSLTLPKGSTGYGGEVAWMHGTFWAQGEYGTRKLRQRDEAGGLRYDYDAWALQTGWMLSGEAAPYSASTGVWTGLKVNAPVGSGGGGAWELALRYEELDYTDAPIGGDGHATTVGLNWYLNNYFKVMFNGSFWQTDNRSGAYQGPDSGQSFGVRTQVAF